MTLSEDANAELDRLQRGMKSPWVDASVLGMMAMARESARVFVKSQLTKHLVSLAVVVSAEFPGTTCLELLANADRGQRKVSLLASLRDIQPLMRCESSAVLVMAYVYGVDARMFNELVGVAS
jgi:hypothetical protein